MVDLGERAGTTYIRHLDSQNYFFEKEYLLKFYWIIFQNLTLRENSCIHVNTWYTRKACLIVREIWFFLVLHRPSRKSAFDSCREPNNDTAIFLWTWAESLKIDFFAVLDNPCDYRRWVLFPSFAWYLCLQYYFNSVSFFLRSL